MENRENRKLLEGVVVSNKMDKTVVVEVLRKTHNRKYQKLEEHRKKYYAHDESNSLSVGQKVTLMETRPLSKLKRWRVVESIETK